MPVKYRRPLSSSLIERSGYHGLMTQRQRPAAAQALTRGQRLRQLANLVNGTTLLGLALARVAGTAVSRGPRGLVVAAGYKWRLPRAGAVAVGNVIICRSPAERLTTNAALLGHEERHCSQYAGCLGLPFLPLYFLAAGWSQLRTGNPASANIFERLAGLEAGGYVDISTPKPAPRGAGGIEV
ncbi:MAG: hypothetical protein JWQ75_1156 [Pseudarthrobacter sp.]|nr:hypothetical protein [Pseudarthrobacter sp.]